MRMSLRSVFAPFFVLIVLALPIDAGAEHCAGANYVDNIEPIASEVWEINRTRNVSWLVGSSCGLLTYQVEMSRNGAPFEILGVTDPLYFDGRFEYPWLVTGPAQSEVRFRVKRLLVDRVTTYAYTAPIQIKVAVPVRTSSWAAVRARF